MIEIPRTVREIPAARVLPGWVVTARSYLVDRILPDCEEIRMAPVAFGGGTFWYEGGPVRFGPQTGATRLGRLRRRVRRGPVRRLDGVLVDLRWYSPANWAHFLNDHLPITFTMAEATGIPWDELRLLLPEGIPGHILKATALFGLETVVTDDRVEGHGLSFGLDPVTSIRSVRPHWVQTDAVQAALAAAGLHEPSERPLPRRALILRRDSRRILNGAEIEAALAPHGFETVYPEDFSVLDQFRLFARAEWVAAIHGAGLAPMMYRPRTAPPLRLVEIMPVGHMSNNFRAMAGVLGHPWVGVRGRLRPEHVRPAYAFDRPFLRYTLQDFEVDPVSIARAVALHEDPDRALH